MDLSFLLLGILPTVGGIAGYLLNKEIDRKYILELEDHKKTLQQELEDYKTQQQVRFKAELIAELLAIWISNPTDLSGLNKLTFQAFLWLPDDIALELSRLLSHHKDRRSVVYIIAEVRKHLLKETSITQEEVITFSRSTRYGAIELGNEIIPTAGS